MTAVRTAHTAELDAETLTAPRALLYEVFDDMTQGRLVSYAPAGEVRDRVGHTRSSPT